MGPRLLTAEKVPTVIKSSVRHLRRFSRAERAFLLILGFSRDLQIVQILSEQPSRLRMSGPTSAVTADLLDFRKFEMADEVVLGGRSLYSCDLA